MRRFRLGVLVSALALAACVGPPSLRQSVLGYDDTISRIERELLLVNIGRMHRQLPPHFTVTSAIAATFDYRTNAGIAGIVAEAVGTNSYTLNLGASAAENPTFSIVPVQGEEFTRRILSPMEESKFAFLIFQGAPIDMVLRLMADGIEEQNPDGTFRRFVLNRPAADDEYAEFRRRVAHLAWLNAERKLFVGPLSYSETVQRVPKRSNAACRRRRPETSWRRWKRASLGVATPMAHTPSPEPSTDGWRSPITTRAPSMKPRSGH